MEHYLPLLEKKGRAIFYAKPVQDTLPEYFLSWLQKQKLTPKELTQILYRCQEESCEAIMTETPSHTILRNQIDTIGYRFMSMRKRPWLGRFS